MSAPQSPFWVRWYWHKTPRLPLVKPACPVIGVTTTDDNWEGRP